MKKITIVLAFVLCAAASRVRASEPSVNVDFVRPLGMGGAFTAVADDQNIFNYNPAGLVQRTGGQWTLLELVGGVNTDAIDAAKFIKDNENDLTNWNTLPADRQVELTNEINNDISKLNPRAYAAINTASFVSGPGIMGLHGGFGVLGVSDINFRMDMGVTVPNISYYVNTDLMLPLSLAKRFDAPFVPGTIGVGVTGKFIRRYQVLRLNQSVLELDNMEAPPVAEGKAIGLDAGFLYQPTNRFNFGMMVKDVGSTKIKYDAVEAENGFSSLPARDTLIKPVTNLGISFVPKTLFFLLPTTDRWTFSADVKDIFQEDEQLFFQQGFKQPVGDDFYTHFYMGTEFRYFFFRFRGGAYQGYPSLGLGIDWPFIKLDYAYYSREMGDSAGDKREKNHIASIGISFGSGKTEARERIKQSKEDRTQRGMAIPESSVIPTPTSPASVEPGKAGETPTQKPVENAPKQQNLPQ